MRGPFMTFHRNALRLSRCALSKRHSALRPFLPMTDNVALPEWNSPFAEGFSSSAGFPINISEDGEKDSEALEVIRARIERVMELRSSKLSALTVERAVRAFCQAYQEIVSESVKASVLTIFARDYSVNREEIKVAARQYSESYEPEHLPRLEEGLRESLVPAYVWLFKKIAQLEGGVKFLVDLRSDLISISPPETKALNLQLKSLLSHWFSVGFLELNHITWDSPCTMLQKISDYEAVHPMRNWTDLKSRVGDYRRCFVFTHRSMPGEPIVVLHVALTSDEIPAEISQVVKHHRKVKKFESVDGGGPISGFNNASIKENPDLCTTATFYSITSTQKGLQGIELGTHIIKEAVSRLLEEFPKMTTFSTLSPIPGFKSWLLMTLLSTKSGETPIETLFTEHEISTLNLRSELNSFIQKIKSGKWHASEDLSRDLELPLMRLCARYLFLEKRRRNALDSVANFHLRNGATLWRLNWKGDISPRGLNNSCGIMVNYRYFRNQLESNSTQYQENCVIEAGSQILQLTNQAQRLGV